MVNPRNQDPWPPAFGPEGVPIDAPDNDGPAISPHAVWRMHRAEDDPLAWDRSPEYTDLQNQAIEDRREQERWIPHAETSAHAGEPSRGVGGPDTPTRDPNPSHDTAKDPSDPPRGRGDGELLDQPGSTSEARQPGADPGAPGARKTGE